MIFDKMGVELPFGAKLHEIFGISSNCDKNQDHIDFRNEK